MQLKQRSSEIDLDAYFQRIGYSGDRSPTLTTLQAIHQRHVSTHPNSLFVTSLIVARPHSDCRYAYAKG